MADTPDLYADNIAVSANQFGLTLTLQRSEPSLEPGPQEPDNVVVGRIRMSHELARILVELITRTLAQASQATGQVSSQVRH